MGGASDTPFAPQFVLAMIWFVYGITLGWLVWG